MAYVDDWGSASEADRNRLMQPCADARCTHSRYQHGLVSLGYAGRFESHKPGVCKRCPCLRFWEEPPITTDEVLDASLALRGDVHLSDFNIEPVRTCGATVWGRYEKDLGGSAGFQCLRTKGHKGDHSPEED